MSEYTNNMVRISNVASGAMGEKVAREYLEGLGYKFVAANYKGAGGEIDLIFIDGSFIVFVEVKCRLTDHYGYPEESLTPAKQSKIRRTASYFMMNKEYQIYQPRFDVVGIYMSSLNHTIDAFY